MRIGDNWKRKLQCTRVQSAKKSIQSVKKWPICVPKSVQMQSYYAGKEAALFRETPSPRDNTARKVSFNNTSALSTTLIFCKNTRGLEAHHILEYLRISLVSPILNNILNFRLRILEYMSPM